MKRQGAQQMSIRNLDAIFHPKAIASIGASNQPRSVGSVMAKNLLSGGFSGPVMFVNPNHKTIEDIACHADVASLPRTPDVAVICTPAPTIPHLIEELGERGTKGAVIVSAGFKELGNERGLALHQNMLNAARPKLLRVIGPNGIGMILTPHGVDASFAPLNTLQ